MKNFAHVVINLLLQAELIGMLIVSDRPIRR
jgi:hypothetical protein